MVTFARAASIDDLRAIARRRIPRFVFDFIDGAAESETGLARNRAAFERLLLVPRYLRCVESRDLSVELFGRRWGAPVGIAPTGLTGLVWPGADLHKARTAAKLNLPLLLSTASSHTIEEVVDIAPEQTWFQLYAMRDEAMMKELVGRAKAVGIKVLVVTVDIPVHGKRERDIRNGFVLPLRLTAGNVMEFLRCPAWSLSMLRAGPPRYANFEPYFESKNMKYISRTAFVASLAGDAFDWTAWQRLREMWPHFLVLKGLVSATDVAEAAHHGADGVILSNHGGRQFDAGPAPIEVLPAAVEAAAGRLTVMLDSGIRRGVDIVRARALGASYTFVGRPPLYGLGAGAGEAGTDKAMRILIDEVDRALAMLGCTSFEQVGRDHLLEVPGVQ